ncbi:MAG: ankyrin repeat domain-containing protein [Roseibacillus sp.]
MKTLFTLFLLLLTTQAQEPPSLEDSFREALYSEEVDGDPEAALESYRKLSDKFQKQRQLAARTLYRQAECLRKLDRTDEAITTYQTLLTRYPEDKNLTKLAQENLTALGQEPASPSNPDSPAPIDPQDQKIAELKKLLAESPDLLNTGPLQLAAQKSQLKVAAFLLDAGADVSRINGNRTPLQEAAHNGHRAMCELLIKRGANLEQEGPQALDYALGQGHQSIIDYLLSLGLIPYSSHLTKAIQSSNGQKSLSQLLNALPKSQKPAIINPVLEAPPLLATLDSNQKKFPLLELLLEHGANPDHTLTVTLPHSYDSQKFQISPLAYLLETLKDQKEQGTKFAKIEALLAAGADPNLKSGSNRLSPLAQALNFLTQDEQKEIANKATQTLLRSGADWNKAEPTILARAIELGSQKWFDNMIQAGVLETLPKDAKQLAIDNAVKAANPNALKTLIDHGLVPYKSATHNLIQNLFCRYSKNSKSFGLREDAQKILTCLEQVLATNPDLNYQSSSFQVSGKETREKHTPLQFLAQYGFHYSNGQQTALHILNQLLKAGADPNFGPIISLSSRPPSSNFTPFAGEPLALFLSRDDRDSTYEAKAIQILLQAGANPEVVKHLEKRDYFGRENQIPNALSECFHHLWQAAHFDPSNNPHRPNGLWLSQGFTSLQTDQEPIFRCLLSKESASVPTTLKDFLHRANQERDRLFNFSGDQPLLVYRLNEAEPTSILFREHLASGQDFALQWGDIIEIPSRHIDSKRPKDEVTIFLQAPRPIDLAITLGDNQILTNTNNPTGPIFRYQPKSSRYSTERVRIATGIAPLFLNNCILLRPNPDTGKLVPIDSTHVVSGDRIHFHVHTPQPGPVIPKSNTGRICQSLEGPFWEISSEKFSSMSFSLSEMVNWLPHDGRAAVFLALLQPHGIPLQPIDWKKAHVLFHQGVNQPHGKKMKHFSLEEFFLTSPPQIDPNASFVLVLPPAQEDSPFPDRLNEIFTETLSTPWSLKIGMQDPVQHQWTPRFPDFTREENRIIWQAPPLDQQDSPALPLTLDLVTAQLETPRDWKNITLFPSQKLIRINPYEKGEGPPQKPSAR